MIKKTVFVFVFIFIISLPCLLLCVGDKDTAFKALTNDFFEVRSPSGFKTLIIKSRRYFLDNYKTKKTLYSFYKKNISDRFTETPSVSNVLYGKDSWLFIGDTHNDAFSEAKGVLKFTDSELSQIKNNIKRCKSWCEKEGIRFYIAIPPGKHTAYKEFLPYDFPDTRTKLDQLISVEESVIDIRKKIKEGKIKEKKALYFKTDTHWNDLGAFYGYQAIMKFIKRDFPNLDFYRNKDFKEKYAYYQGDVSRILGEQGNYKEKMLQLELKNKIAKEEDSKLQVPSYHRFDRSTYEIRFSNPEAFNSQKVVFFRDSFSKSLIKYFSASFKETLFIYNHYFDQKLIKQEKPDIFVYEITERFIDRLLIIHNK